VFAQSRHARALFGFLGKSESGIKPVCLIDHVTNPAHHNVGGAPYFAPFVLLISFRAAAIMPRTTALLVAGSTCGAVSPNDDVAAGLLIGAPVEYPEVLYVDAALIPRE
jgi:hypothetical protein